MVINAAVFGKMKIKCLLLTLFWLVTSYQPVRADSPAKDLCDLPFKLTPPSQPRKLGLVTETTISIKGMAEPSLWWDVEQFDPFFGQFVEHWVAYPKEHRIDLVVNRQLWSLMDYAQRYSYVNQLGNVARNYQYSLRFLTLPNRCLATYVCQTTTDSVQNCLIHFDSIGLGGLEQEETTGILSFLGGTSAAIIPKIGSLRFLI